MTDNLTYIGKHYAMSDELDEDDMEELEMLYESGWELISILPMSDENGNEWFNHIFKRIK